MALLYVILPQKSHKYNNLLQRYLDVARNDRANKYIYRSTNTRNKMKKIIFSMIFMLAPLAAAFAQDIVGKWKLRMELQS